MICVGGMRYLLDVRRSVAMGMGMVLIVGMKNIPNGVRAIIQTGLWNGKLDPILAWVRPSLAWVDWALKWLE